MSRRQLIQTLALTATVASRMETAEAATPANAVYINHVSMQVADYTKTRDFYSGLFGMKVTDDNGKQVSSDVRRQHPHCSQRDVATAAKSGSITSHSWPTGIPIRQSSRRSSELSVASDRATEADHVQDPTALKRRWAESNRNQERSENACVN